MGHSSRLLAITGTNALAHVFNAWPSSPSPRISKLLRTRARRRTRRWQAARLARPPRRRPPRRRPPPRSPPPCRLARGSTLPASRLHLDRPAGRDHPPARGALPRRLPPRLPPAASSLPPRPRPPPPAQVRRCSLSLPPLPAPGLSGHLAMERQRGRDRRQRQREERRKKAIF